MTAPVFLVRCPRCFGIHPWRAAKYEAHTVERVEPHSCSHGKPCVVNCAHGKPMGLGCCSVNLESCPACAETRAKVYAQPLPRPECLVCREIKRQGGTNCPTFKTKKDGDWTVSIPDPLCRWRKLERMPPWCAGSTDAEKLVFLTAIPAEKRQKAIEDARANNKQEGAAQKYEKKAVEKAKPKGQTSMF